MIHPEIAKAIQEIGVFLGKRDEELAKEDPEACVLSLLRSIKSDLPSVSSMLSITTEGGFYEEDVREAREILDRGTKKESKSPMQKA